MKKVFVFCVGGTGIRVMKSITMLMAGGMSTNGYAVVPIIVDPHMDLEEKTRLNSLIDQYHKIHRDTIYNGSDTLNPLDGFFGADLRTIDDLNNTSNNAQQESGSKEKFKSYIGNANLAANDINQFLVQTLFSSKSLESPLSVGFKGNPNVGTVALGDMIEGNHGFNVSST